MQQSTIEPNQTAALRDSEWAKRFFNYEPGEQDSAFWQFVASAGVPAIRLTARKVMFDEAQVRAFVARKNTGKVVAS